MSVKKVNKTTGATTKVAGLVNSEKVNTMYEAFPSDASASNKLVSDATADEKISDESQVIFEVMGEMGAKNLLPVTVAEIKKNNTSNGAWNGNVFTTTGGKITFTINTTDGVTVDSIRVQTNPSGTGVSAYSLYLFDDSKKLTAPTRYTPISDNDAVSPPFSCGCTVDGTNYAVNNGAKYKDLPAGTLTKSWIYSESGSTVDKTFYPMIRLASIEDDTYEPYAKTNRELTKDTIGLLDNDFANGAVNLFPITVTTQTVSGITFTVNNDGTITANGTSTAEISFSLYGSQGNRLFDTGVLQKGKSYKISGTPSGITNAYMYLRTSDGATRDSGEGAIVNTSLSTTGGNFAIAMAENVTLNNVIFKPMITLADIPNSDYAHYVPYAKSNKELTEVIPSDASASNKLVTESEFKSYGIKTIWTGNKTKGDTGMNFDASPYDLCFARVGGTWCRLITGVGSGSTTRKKFTAVYAGRDTPNGNPYEQYYLFDILNDGTVATCGWFNVGNLNVQNAKLAAQKALELAIAGTSTWTDPTWKTLADVETSVSVSQIIGIKFQTKS